MPTPPLAPCYRLVFEGPTGSGHDLAPDRVVPAAQRSMDVFLSALGELPPPAVALTPALAEQLARWTARSDGPPAPLGTSYVALTWWSRLHGLVSLELGHHLQTTGVSPGLLFHAEVQALVDQLHRR